MYTYLIGWSKFNRFYYGVRYAKNSNPNDLWTTYFTSSKYKEAALKRWANKEQREKLCASMRGVPKKSKEV